MQKSELTDAVPAQGTPATTPRLPREIPSRVKWLGVLTLGLAICFGRQLYELCRFALGSDLYSYILLIPFISGYLIWLDRKNAPPRLAPGIGTALVLTCLGVAVAAIYWTGVFSDWQQVPQDRLALTTLSFLLFFSAACALTLGNRALRVYLFPLVFLVFMVPMPLAAEHWIETFLQHRSADAAFLMISGVGTPIFRQGTQFFMPGMSIEVAPECSGIHSSLILFIVALVAGQVLFRKGWIKIFFALIVIPLGIARNGFRIFTLSELGIHVYPDVLNSPLHHRGGPIFFALSLIPFFLLAWLLRVWDRKGKPKKNSEPVS